MSEHRKGDWMKLASGRPFWPIDPRPEEVFIEDIAHGLSNLCRFNGHCSKFYSVAQHSVLVSDLLPSDLAMWGLLHDASEAYVADVPRPLKPFLAEYKPIEENVQKAIAERFDLPWPMPAEVKRIDSAILVDEGEAIMGGTEGWSLPEPAAGVTIVPWDHDIAYRAFLNTFERLTWLT